MNNFIIENIQPRGDRKVILTIRSGSRVKTYPATMEINNSIVFSEDLERLLMKPQFNHHKQLLETISDYRSGVKINFPVELSNDPLRRPEAQPVLRLIESAKRGEAATELCYFCNRPLEIKSVEYVSFQISCPCGKSEGFLKGL